VVGNKNTANVDAIHAANPTPHATRRSPLGVVSLFAYAATSDAHAVTTPAAASTGVSASSGAFAHARSAHAPTLSHATKKPKKQHASASANDALRRKLSNARSTLATADRANASASFFSRRSRARRRRRDPPSSFPSAPPSRAASPPSSSSSTRGT